MTKRTYRNSGLLEFLDYELFERDGISYGAVYTGGRFTAYQRRSINLGDFTIYFPVHPSTTLDDINGATHAYDDGTHWHFAKASPEQSHELLHHTTSLIHSSLDPYALRSTNKALTAMTSGRVSVAQVNLATANAFHLFEDECKTQALSLLKSNILGHYHSQSEHPTRQLTTESIRKALSVWKEKASSDNSVLVNRNYIKNSIAELLVSLEQNHTFETAAQRRVRLAATKKQQPQ